jgi:4-alpha-glucanotransferase
MQANFHIHYRTRFGENINVLLQINNEKQTLRCHTYDGENWLGHIQISEKDTVFYKYQVESATQSIEEWGDYRPLSIAKKTSELFVKDYWRSTSNPNNIFHTAAFKDVVFKRSQIGKVAKSTSPKANIVTLQLHAAAIPSHLKCCILGSSSVLGNWVAPLVMSDENFPLWQANIEIEGLNTQFEYKYALYDEKSATVVAWEEGNNRTLSFSFPKAQGGQVCHTDEGFRQSIQRWRGAGIAIPVFSLRSNEGLGIGEFSDLKLMIDWAVATGLKMVQTLPVNDTIANKNWIDSYPYAAISVYALHPLYVSIKGIAPLKDKKISKQLEDDTRALNALDVVDFEAVLATKTLFFKALYQQEKDNFWKDKNVLVFIERNADWLKPYAAFCYLRDTNGTSNFNLWSSHQVFSEATVTEICNPKAKYFDEVALYYFIQYHADKQLSEATNYARSKGVILKGDLPIGIYRYSCDAWVAPQLYNMNGQAGAPPDDFAVAGQNWGFPTYNWEVMAKDNFAWWRNRMTKLSEYFDALRIDHILGFFRIWQIPTDQVEGTMGLFNPRLPYHRNELEMAGLGYNFDRFTKPYIRTHVLNHYFGHDAIWVAEHFLNHHGNGVFELKDFCDNQLKIKTLFQNNPTYVEKKHLEKSLMRLVSEVLLLEEPNSNGTAFNPRITLNTTLSYQSLDDNAKRLFDNIYFDYYYRRHDEFWKQQALWKLPALLNATNMFICGEDLGMIPNSVPGVMNQLNIVALEIQRMPKGATEFGQPEHYPYMSVCSPSCHDMSTIRGWYESDENTAQRFYNHGMYWHGAAPKTCTTQIVEAVVQQHLLSPSIWAVFPIQDLVGMDTTLRRADADAEQINVPANPQHYWRFRFHLSMEQLLLQNKLNEKIKAMVDRTAR